MKRAKPLNFFNTRVETTRPRPALAFEWPSGPPEPVLLAIALALGARDVPGWSSAEEKIAIDLPVVPRPAVEDVRRRILDDLDPLGDRFTAIRSPADRRSQGATFTPMGLVRAMVGRACRFATPDRVVDPGVGSARFLVEAGRCFPRAALIGVELDPVPAILARANLAVNGLASRSRIILDDYRASTIEAIAGRTLYLGNPPYVRHHAQEPRWKAWLVAEARRRGLSASQLSGLHIHFYLATLAKAKPGDFGVFITAAEWLDVNYGRLLRELFLGELGGRRIAVIEPTALPFADAASTAAITDFEVGARPPSIAFQRVATLDDLNQTGGDREVPREILKAESRWSPLTRPSREPLAGHVELGELCRVHRGQVTGANKVWVASLAGTGLPASVLYPSVTKARELIRAGRSLDDSSSLRNVIDLPADLDRFEGSDRQTIERFLEQARALGVDRGYVAANRKAWWSVALRPPAPILATYMARRPPAFVRNRAGARHINIAHGLYPREPLSEQVLDRLIAFLTTSVSTESGRTYAGGLTKFEPREMERLMVPSKEMLERGES